MITLYTPQQFFNQSANITNRQLLAINSKFSRAITKKLRKSITKKILVSESTNKKDTKDPSDNKNNRKISKQLTVLIIDDNNLEFIEYDNR